MTVTVSNAASVVRRTRTAGSRACEGQGGWSVGMGEQYAREKVLPSRQPFKTLGEASHQPTPDSLPTYFDFLPPINPGF